MAVTKEQIQYDSTHMSRLEQSNSQRRKQNGGLQGTDGGEMGSYHLTGTEFQNCKMKKALDEMDDDDD